MRIIAIDPGIAGACACLELGPSGGDEEPRLLDVVDLPTMGDGKRREINGAALFDIFVQYRPTAAIIENVFAMPSIPGADGVRRGMGSASAFKFGMGCGAVRAVVQCAKIPYTLVVPAVWKKYYGLKGPDKEQSRQMAIRRFPERQDLFARKLDHQRAEASLLALYGAKVHA